MEILFSQFETFSYHPLMADPSNKKISVTALKSGFRHEVGYERHFLTTTVNKLKLSPIYSILNFKHLYYYTSNENKDIKLQ